MAIVDIDPPDVDSPFAIRREDAAVSTEASPNGAFRKTFESLGLAQPEPPRWLSENPPPVGWEDVEHGSDAPTERQAWSPTMSWTEQAAELAVGSLSPVLGAARTAARLYRTPEGRAAFQQGNSIVSFFANEERDAPTYREEGSTLGT
jgi:hypothetical protein